MNASIRPLLRLALGSLLVLAPAKALANGIFIQEMSAAGMAQGSAVVAAGDRPSGLFQNAANLAFIPGLAFEFTGTTYFPTGSLTDAQGNSTHPSKNGIFTPHAFLSAKLTDWLSFGFGEFVDFGLALDWPKNWAADFLVTHSALNAFTMNPNLAFGPWKGFAFSVGFDAKWGAVSLERALTTGDSKGRMEFGGQAWGFGLNVGAMFEPVWWLRMGAAYRSGITMRFNNSKVDFTVPEAFAPAFPDQKAAVTLPLPHLVSLGLRFWAFRRPERELSFEVDGWATLWSSYDKLTFRFKQGLGGYANPAYNIHEQINYQKYVNTGQLRLGGEYKLLNKHLALRLGLVWDGNPAPDSTVSPLMPDSHRLKPAMGIGGQYKGFFADIGYSPVFNLPRTVRNKNNPYPTKIRLLTHDVSFSVGYAFDYFAKKHESPQEPLSQPLAPAPAAGTVP